MTLNFQNKIVFPAPETSYTTQSAFGQVIYLPRNIMAQVERKFDNKRQHHRQNLVAKPDKQQPHAEKPPGDTPAPNNIETE